MNNYVYLVPLSNGTFVPYIEETAPSDKAVLLTREGNYPVSLLIVCYDVYGIGEAYECIVQSRSELLQELLLNGQMCNVLVKLWDYNIDHGCSDDIGNLFNLVYCTRMEAVRGNGAVNAKYDFVDTTSLDEYCSRCVFEKRVEEYQLPEDFECTKSDNQTDDLPF